MGGVKDVGHDVLQHRIAQKLQTLVVLRAHGRMGKSALQKGLILELVAQVVH